MTECSLAFLRKVLVMAEKVFDGLLKIGLDRQILIDPVYLNLEELKRATQKTIDSNKDITGGLCKLWFPVVLGPDRNKWLDSVLDEVSNLLLEAGYED